MPACDGVVVRHDRSAFSVMIVFDGVVLAVGPREEVAGRLGEVAAERQVVDRQRQIAVIAEFDPHAGGRTFEFRGCVVLSRDEVQDVGAAQRDGDVARADIREYGFFRDVELQVVERLAGSAEVGDARIGALLEAVDEIPDLGGNPRVSELVRFREVGHGEQHVGSAGEFFGVAVLRVVVVERDAEHFARGA